MGFCNEKYSIYSVILRVNNMILLLKKDYSMNRCSTLIFTVLNNASYSSGYKLHAM